MKVYQKEIDDGLGEILSDSNASLAFTSEISCCDTPVEELLKSTASDKDVEELFPIKSILVSVGWNNNDDIFLKDEVWLARKTPEDKPINYEHNEVDIYGHMTANQCIDADGKTIADDTDVKDVPEFFHLLTTGVLYKNWKDEAKQKTIAEIIGRINKKLGRVSMECYFSGFDYGVIKNGKEYVIARTDETAFLTKFLKVYGGSGVYDGCRIGRALRDISFSGKGIVKNPANPNSIVITETSPFKGIASVITDVLGDKQGEIIMSKEIEVLEGQVTELKKVVASLTAKNEELAKTVSEVGTKAVQTELESARASIVAKDEEIKGLSQKIVDGQALINEFKTKLEASEAKVAEHAQKLDEIKKEQVKATRISKLIAAGLDEKAAAARYEKFASLNDEMFEEVVSLAKPTQASEKKEEVKASDVIDSAEKNKEAALASSNDDNKTKAEKLYSDLADYANNVLGKGKNK